MNIWLLCPLLLIFGLAIGSFLNVLIYRLNNDGVPRFWQGRSFCPKCKHPISIWDNIPLLSYFLLKGHCRNCSQSISWQYPVVELTTAVAFGVTPILYSTTNNLSLLIMLALISIFIVIFFSDVVYNLIPDEMIFVGLILAMQRNFSLGFEGFWQMMAAGLIGGGFFLLIVLLTRFKGMGLGDVKLGFLIGVLLGMVNMIIALWVGFVLGGIMAIILLLLRRTKLSATIALGPFLVVGVLIAALWSQEILGFLGF